MAARAFGRAFASPATSSNCAQATTATTAATCRASGVKKNFVGTVVHPQQWPEDLDYAGKHVVIIGSGATAMTLAPAMAEGGAKVVMVQRSPTYVVSRPDEDAIANTLRKWLPDRLAYAITRWKNVKLQSYFYDQTRVNPGKVKRQLLGLVRQHLGPHYDVDTHFTPRYDPWDQRLCLIPNADLFRAIKSGTLEMVTDGVEGFAEHGLEARLRAGIAGRHRGLGHRPKTGGARRGGHPGGW